MRLEGKIVKSSVGDEHLVFGWASMATDENGTAIVDADGDIIEPAELEQGAYEFVLEWRDGCEEHDRDKGIVASLVESVVFTPEKCAAMGITQQMPVGWWVGFKVWDESTWAKIKSGELTMFSIGGKAKREEITDEQA